MKADELEEWCGICPVRRFFLTHGRTFEKYMPLPDWVKPGTPKECYRNSFVAVSRSPRRLVYCEGLALPEDRLSPLEHAWVMTDDEVVIDPTWHDLWPDRKVEYWGIPFKWPFVRDTVFRTATYGVVDNWEERHPLVNGKVAVEEYLWMREV
jgi:hypothetical protein